MRLSDSELQVINASASHESAHRQAPSVAVCVCENVCVSVGKRGKYLLGEDLKWWAWKDKHTLIWLGWTGRCVCVNSKICVCTPVPECVQYVCVSGWGYRSGWGLVQSERAPTQPPQVGFGQSSNKHQHEFLFSPLSSLV